MAKRDLAGNGVAARTDSVSPSFYYWKNKTKHTPYLYWESKKPPTDEPQMEKAMATTPFHTPSSLAVMWWSSRKRGNMVMAPCSPVKYRITSAHTHTKFNNCKCSFDRIIENVLDSYHIASEFFLKTVFKLLIISTHHKTNLVKTKHLLSENCEEKIITWAEAMFFAL